MIPNGRFSVCVIGAGMSHVRLPAARESGERYRLSHELPRIAAELKDREQVLSVGEYAEHLGNALKDSIDSRCSWLQRIVTITLFLDGYIDNDPDRASVTIECGTGAARAVLVKSQPLLPGRWVGVGSNRIYTSLFAPVLQYEPMRPYWSVCRQEIHNLDQAAGVAYAIIDAQCDERVALLDPKSCAAIGGDVHVAEVTADGFTWRERPL